VGISSTLVVYGVKLTWCHTKYNGRQLFKISRGCPRLHHKFSHKKISFNVTFSLQKFKLHWIILLETDTLFGN